MLEKEKYKVDYSDLATFKGITIYFEYLKEGIQYVKKKGIQDVFVKTLNDKEKHVVDFSFLQEIQFLKTFHWTVALSKKSDISGIYNLINLENFRWGVQNAFEIDFSMLETIKKLSINHDFRLKNLHKLKVLDNLFLQSVQSENCKFLSGLDNLTELRIIKGKFNTLDGLGDCKNIKNIFLQNCSNLTDTYLTLKKLASLNSIIFESCKNIDLIKDGRKDLRKNMRININYKNI